MFQSFQQGRNKVQGVLHGRNKAGGSAGSTQCAGDPAMLKQMCLEVTQLALQDKVKT